MTEPKKQIEWADSKKSALFIVTTFCFIAALAAIAALIAGYVAAGAP